MKKAILKRLFKRHCWGDGGTDKEEAVEVNISWKISKLFF